MSDNVLSDTFFASFDLHPLLKQGLTDCGFTRCTPIQALTLPVALAGRDVAGQAQTGTGKTCAFLVSLMNHLLTTPARAARKDTDPRALIIAPTRELAIQIDKDAQAIGRHTGLAMALIYGGVDYDKQRQELRDGCDIVIATPGRLLDYYKQRVFGLDNVEVMVVDEADRMFDLGFIKDVRYIFHRLPPRDERQVLLYSATLSLRVLELAYEHMHEAQKLVVEADHVTADHVRQSVYFPAREEKPALLLNLLAREKPERALVFINTRAETERVTARLRRHGYRVGMLSGNVPQVKRQKVLERFKRGETQLLVCTDVAARGLHIPHVSHVFNYDLPQEAEDYVHRIGRTARLGEAGDAISFACDLYAVSLPDIETYIEQKIPVAAVEPELLTMPAPIGPDTSSSAVAPASAHPVSAHGSPRHHDGNHANPRRAFSSGHARPEAAAAGASPKAAGTPVNPEKVIDGGATTVASDAGGAAAAGTKPQAAGAGAGTTGTGTPPRRSHRGGRHRNRRSSGTGAPAAAEGPTASAPRSGGVDRPQRKPATPASAGAGGRVQSAQPHTRSAKVPAQPRGSNRGGGLFRRLVTGLFRAR